MGNGRETSPFCKAQSKKMQCLVDGTHIPKHTEKQNFINTFLIASLAPEAIVASKLFSYTSSK